MSSNPLEAADADRCENCSASMHGPYCAVCGQRRLDLERPFTALAREAIDAFFALTAVTI